MEIYYMSESEREKIKRKAERKRIELPRFELLYMT